MPIVRISGQQHPLFKHDTLQAQFAGDMHIVHELMPEFYKTILNIKPSVRIEDSNGSCRTISMTFIPFFTTVPGAPKKLDQ